MNGFFGFNYAWVVLHGAVLNEIRQQCQLVRSADDFIGRRADDRRRLERRASARRVEDVVPALDLSQPAPSASAKIIYLKPAGTSAPVYPRAARVLTANPADALTLNIDQEAVLWLSRQDDAYQQRLNRLLRQQMRRVGR